MYRIIITLTFLSLVSLKGNVASADEWKIGDVGYLCLKHSLHYEWPEKFATQVEIIGQTEKKFKIKVIDAYPHEGRVNEEQTAVKGDIMKISKNRLYSKSQAGVTAGPRFQGKPICQNLMK